MIALADIATRATEVSNLLGTLTVSAASNAQIDTIAKTLPELSKKLDAQFEATTKSLEAEPTLEDVAERATAVAEARSCKRQAG